MFGDNILEISLIGTVNSTDLYKLFLGETQSMNAPFDDFAQNYNTIENFLKMMLAIDLCFDYCILRDKNRVIIAFCWMTGTMRDNLNRYGTSISSDSLQNTPMYSYHSLLGKDCGGRLRLFVEGLIVEGSDVRVLFLLDSLFAMARRERMF